jgi:arabinofuranosyltransferase
MQTNDPTALPHASRGPLPDGAGAVALALGAGVVALLHSLALARAFRFNNVDDAYIAFRYGWNLVHGRGLVFNPGEHVEGYTSFLWTVLLAPFTRLPVDIAWVSIGLGLVCMLAALAGAGVLAAREAGGGRAGVAAVLFLVAVDGSFAFWAVGGMETLLFTALVVWSVVVLEAPRPGPVPIGAGLLLGLATLARPEGGLLFVLALLVCLARRGRAAGRDLVHVAIGWSTLVLPHLLWRRAYYGAWLPNTFHNKVSLGDASFETGLHYVWSFVRWRFGVPMLALLAIDRPAWRWMPSLAVAFAIAFVGYVAAIGGDWPIANRFLVPVIPFLALFVVRGIRRRLRHPVLRPVAFAVAIAAVAAGTTQHAERWGMIRRNDNVTVETQRKRFGLWLRTHLEPGSLIAVGPAGAIPYYSRLPSLDMWGLTDAHIARTPRFRFQPGHDRFDAAYVLSRRPRVIVGAAGFPRGMLPPGYVEAYVPAAARPREPTFCVPGALR